MEKRRKDGEPAFSVPLDSRHEKKKKKLKYGGRGKGGRVTPERPLTLPLLKGGKKQQRPFAGGRGRRGGEKKGRRTGVLCVVFKKKRGAGSLRLLAHWPKKSRWKNLGTFRKRRKKKKERGRRES